MMRFQPQNLLFTSTNTKRRTLLQSLALDACFMERE